MITRKNIIILPSSRSLQEVEGTQHEYVVSDNDRSRQRSALMQLKKFFLRITLIIIIPIGQILMFILNGLWLV